MAHILPGDCENASEKNREKCAAWKKLRFVYQSVGHVAVNKVTRCRREKVREETLFQPQATARGNV